MAQAERLSERFVSSMEDQQRLQLQVLLDNIEIITVSGNDKSGRITIPILALPIATERLYLISDLGSSASRLSKRYPFVDFTTEFRRDDDEEEEWWFTVTPIDTNTAGNGFGRFERRIPSVLCRVESNGSRAEVRLPW